MRLLFRVIAIGIVLIGTGLYVAWSFVDQSRLSSWFARLPRGSACFWWFARSAMFAPIWHRYGQSEGDKSLIKQRKTSTQAMQRTPKAFASRWRAAVRSTFEMISTVPLRPTRGLVRRR